VRRSTEAAETGGHPIKDGSVEQVHVPRASDASALSLGDPPDLTVRGFCETAVVPRRRQFATLSDRIDQLMLDVFVRDDGERISRLEDHLASDFVFVSPTAVVEGAQGLSDAYSTYRHDEWLQVALRRSSQVDMHHAHFRYAWERLERGTAVTRGWSFGWVDAAGRISRIVSFNDPVP
jgi:hypothetical protein